MKSCYQLILLLLLVVAHTHDAAAASPPVLFSSLPLTLILTASPNQAQVLTAGEDTITLTWGLNQSLITQDSSYSLIKAMLCFAPISQLDRGWRTTLDDLTNDKTCQFIVFDGPYTRNHTIQWKIQTDVPTAVYFLRVNKSLTARQQTR